MIVTVEVPWPMNIRILISYFHDMILSAGCSIDDRDGGSVMANEYENVDQLLSWRDSFGGWSIDDRDSVSVMANEYETVYQLLSRHHSFSGVFD